MGRRKKEKPYTIEDFAPREEHEEPIESKKAQTSIFDFLNSVSYDKTNIMTEENESVYLPYMINRGLSHFLDTIFYANEMNIRPTISKRMHYDYLRLVVRKKKRYAGKWLKREEDDKVALIQEYFDYSRRKAEQVLGCFTEADFEYMKQRTFVGGRRNERE